MLAELRQVRSKAPRSTRVEVASRRNHSGFEIMGNCEENMLRGSENFGFGLPVRKMFSF